MLLRYFSMKQITIFVASLMISAVAMMPIFSQDSLPGGEEFGLTMEELILRVEEVEDLISECMSEAGFEYIAVDFNTIRQGMLADKSLPGMSEREFMAEYGFGISTFYTGAAPQLSELATPQQIGLGERNIEIFASLPPTDQIAYNQTLFGENPDATLAVALEIEDFSRTDGCTRAAIEQVFDEEELSATYLNPLDAMIEEDPRMVIAVEEFLECVNKEGFEYTHPSEIERDFRSRLDEITQDIPLEFLSSEQLEELEALQEEELTIGIVVYKCEATIIDPVEDRVERDLRR